jgi:hypothetical protein
LLPLLTPIVPSAAPATARGSRFCRMAGGILLPA